MRLYVTAGNDAAEGNFSAAAPGTARDEADVAAATIVAQSLH